MFILTNADDAEDFKIVEAPLTSPTRENWRDVVAHRPGCLITSLLEFAGYLVRLERIDGLPRIVVRDLASEEEHVIDFDEEAYALRLVPGHEFETAILRFTYSSMTTPQRTYDYDMAARARVMRKQQEVPSAPSQKGSVAHRRLAASRRPRDAFRARQN